MPIICSQISDRACQSPLFLTIPATQILFLCWIMQRNSTAESGQIKPEGSKLSDLEKTKCVQNPGVAECPEGTRQKVKEIQLLPEGPNPLSVSVEWTSSSSW